MYFQPRSQWGSEMELYGPLLLLLLLLVVVVVVVLVLVVVVLLVLGTFSKASSQGRLPK